MLFSVNTTIKGNRSVFGYSGQGSAGSGGKTDPFEALDLALSMKDRHDWTYLSWQGDTMHLTYESKIGPDEQTQTLVLHPETYFEFQLLKNWEINNGFFVQGSD